jgi:putative tryptophan/tyrosine transport system substrate-binding protein
MPIERPRRFHFAVDLRAAATLGLAMPHTLLAQADEVIE